MAAPPSNITASNYSTTSLFGPWRILEKEVRTMAEDLRPGKREGEDVRHVGGVSNSLGGVDPEIEETLMRLSGGP
jgi:hypothetical protein